MCAVTMANTKVTEVETVVSVAVLTVGTFFCKIHFGVVATVVGIHFHFVLAGWDIYFGINHVPDRTINNHGHIVSYVWGNVGD